MEAGRLEGRSFLQVLWLMFFVIPIRRISTDKQILFYLFSEQGLCSIYVLSGNGRKNF